MKKEWTKPELDLLDIKMTMQGPGIRDVDLVYEDEDENGFLHAS